MKLSTGNIIDLIMAASFVFAMIRGWHTGLVLKLGHLVTIIASCIVSHFMANLLKAGIAKSIMLPILEKDSKGTISSLPFAKDGMSYVAEVLSYYVIFGVCFIISMIVLSQVIKVLKLVDYIPVIGKIDKLGGAVLGFFIEFIVLYIVCAFIFHLIPQDTLDQWGLTKQAIENTYILHAFVK